VPPVHWHLQASGARWLNISRLLEHAGGAGYSAEQCRIGWTAERLENTPRSVDLAPAGSYATRGAVLFHVAPARAMAVCGSRGREADGKGGTPIPRRSGRLPDDLIGRGKGARGQRPC